MKKKSALGLAITGGLEVVMTPWAGVAPLIEEMRHIEVMNKADRILPLKKSFQRRWQSSRWQSSPVFVVKGKCHSNC